jgi:cytochrome c biogenesis protein CcmG/thiol:disulfide interchange protein DsbE
MSDVAVEERPPPGEPGRRPRRIAPFVALGVVVLLVALFVVLARAKPGTSDSADSPLLGRPAPEVVSTTLDDQRFDLARRKGSWVVLNFFNSTCVPCIREHPELVSFAESQAALGTEGAELYTVINDDEDAAIEDFFAERGGDWPKVRDADGAIAVAFGVAKVPETWIIDPDGVVVRRIVGELDAPFLEGQLQELREQRG